MCINQTKPHKYFLEYGRKSNIRKLRKISIIRKGTFCKWMNIPSNAMLL